MGEIVAAFATAHAPQLITRPPDEKPEQLDASIAAMREMGKILDETKPDVIIIFGSDHLETFSMTCVHTFATPFKYVLEGRNIPVIPFFTNVYLPPLPTAKRCAELGRAIAEIVKSRRERVCIVASGGMSHY